ncbi:D-glycero-beta-D-manno-heptose 1-phosphate adenylyltransferase [Embleya scabrispora]|uniref:D-glycero-beta-D-manno-heptose 1-phosphate adenylyltransferase n=1 Tax=Embleya scabrispora TaxID=159449 RepID=UPI001F18AB12|nr:D-glycero-beta-D-manno-heptose 1-phosphate adenylyltransferase [Embleya scabrispora]
MGDTLLDRDLVGTARRLCPDAPAPVLDDPIEHVRPGGAGLAALLAAREGRPVVLITALGVGAEADLLRTLLRSRLDVIELPCRGRPAEKSRVLAGERSLLRLDRPARGPIGPPGPDALQALASAAAILVSDYGNGVTAGSALRAAIAARAGRVPVVWDPHPRGGDPLPDLTLVTPNRAEALQAAGIAVGHDDAADAMRVAAEAAAALCRTWSARAVCVTLGSRGALLSRGAEPFVVPAPPVRVNDPCGAGDRFAVCVTGGLADGRAVPEAIAGAVRATADFLAAGGATEVARDLDGGGGRGGRRREDECGGSGSSRSEQVRAAGGTVVATGGCFDLLHAGHIRTLRAARALGDCLVVCLNSDASVRSLKGPSRPFHSAEDRSEVLAALECVDEVVVFEEDTPEAVIGRLRPDVWVKGGDYAADRLPEAALVASYGGQAVTVPYLAGRSTTRIASAAADAVR